MSNTSENPNPFAAPTGPVNPTGPSSSPINHQFYTFRSLKELVGVIYVLIGTITLCLLLITAAKTFLMIADPEFEPAQTIIIAMIGMSLLNLAAWIATAITTWMFMYRANANLRAAGTRLEYTPGWCVGWWFVPFMNLIKPFYCMGEIFNESTSLEQKSWSSGAGIVGAWWAFYIFGNILGSIESRLYEALGENSLYIFLSLASTICTILAGIYLIRVTRRISNAQHATILAGDTWV